MHVDDQNAAINLFFVTTRSVACAAAHILLHTGSLKLTHMCLPVQRAEL